MQEPHRDELATAVRNSSINRGLEFLFGSFQSSSRLWFLASHLVPPPLLPSSRFCLGYSAELSSCLALPSLSSQTPSLGSAAPLLLAPAVAAMAVPAPASSHPHSTATPVLLPLLPPAVASFFVFPAWSALGVGIKVNKRRPLWTEETAQRLSGCSLRRPLLAATGTACIWCTDNPCRQNTRLVTN